MSVAIKTQKEVAVLFNVSLSKKLMEVPSLKVKSAIPTQICLVGVAVNAVPKLTLTVS